MCYGDDFLDVFDFTVVNAEEITKGIVLEYEASTRTANTAVVVAKAVGYTQWSIHSKH